MYHPTQKCLRFSFAATDADADTRNYYRSASFSMLALMQNATMLRIITINVSLHSVGILMCVILSVILLNVFIPSVAAPLEHRLLPGHGAT